LSVGSASTLSVLKNPVSEAVEALFLRNEIVLPVTADPVCQT
jgi:hypothetical protein